MSKRGKHLNPPRTNLRAMATQAETKTEEHKDINVMRVKHTPKGYSLRSHIEKTHFDALRSMNLMKSFPKTDKDDKPVLFEGKQTFVNFIQESDYEQLQKYCSKAGLTLEVIEPESS